MEKIFAGAVFAMHVRADKPWSDYTEQERDSFTKRLVTAGVTACPAPPPMHLRMLIERPDPDEQVWWQTWVLTGQQDMVFNGPGTEPCPLLVPAGKATDD